MKQILVNRAHQSVCDDGIHIGDIAPEQRPKCKYLSEYQFFNVKEEIRSFWNKEMQKAKNAKNFARIKELRKLKKELSI